MIITPLNDVVGNVTILILVEGSLQQKRNQRIYMGRIVTILILVEGSLQQGIDDSFRQDEESHNPYFSRRFFAIGHRMDGRRRLGPVTILILVEGSLQYKNQRKSITFLLSQSLFQQKVLCNILFNRWSTIRSRVTILILVEGSLQFFYSFFLFFLKPSSQSLFQQKVLCNDTNPEYKKVNIKVTILILVEGSLQYPIICNCWTDKISHNPYFSRRFFAMLKNPAKSNYLDLSQSLFQQKVLCNIIKLNIYMNIIQSQSLFQQKVLCNSKRSKFNYSGITRHNPYFSRRFFAISYIDLDELKLNLSQSLFQQKVLCN